MDIKKEVMESIKALQPGESVTYWTGFITNDRDKLRGGPDWQKVDEMAKAVMEYAENPANQIELSQRKNTSMYYQYIARRKNVDPKPKHLPTHHGNAKVVNAKILDVPFAFPELKDAEDREAGRPVGPQTVEVTKRLQ